MQGWFGAPWALVGSAVFDGAGKVTATAMEATGGVIDRGFVEGTYTVGPDCLGTVTVKMRHEIKVGDEWVEQRRAIHRLHIAVGAGGDRILWLHVDTFPARLAEPPVEVTDGGTVISGIFERV